MSNSSRIQTANLSRETRTEVVAGYAIIGVFFGVLLGWAAFIPLSSAAIAPGIIRVQGFSKTIQHLEGGIVRGLNVSDGDEVSRGQVLIKLDDIQIKTEFEMLQAQLIVTTARESRLFAEFSGKEKISFPEWLYEKLLDKTSEAMVAKAIKRQMELFDTRTGILNNQLEIYNTRLKESKNQIHELQGGVAALTKQMGIVSDELKKTHEYLKKGWVTQRDIFKLQEGNAGIEANIKDKQAQLASVQEQIGQLQYQKNELKISRVNEASQQLRETRDRVIELTHLMSQARDKLNRTSIRAPIDGVVVNLKTHTIGGVISPGDPLLDVVPNSQNLVIDARVNPKDRDTVQFGQSAEIRFTAFNKRSSIPLKGQVVTISADRLIDEKTNEPYYATQVKLLEDPRRILGESTIFPGMQAEVIIVTGKRTALDYLIRPFLRSFSRALRED